MTRVGLKTVSNVNKYPSIIGDTGTRFLEVIYSSLVKGDLLRVRIRNILLDRFCNLFSD